MPLLTDVLLRKTRRPRQGRIELWDSKTTGLVFRLTAKGARSWSVYYRHNGTQRRFTLGPYRADGAAEDGLTLTKARARARDVLRDAADGRDPAAEKRKARAAAVRSGSSFAALARRWLESPAAANWRPKTRTEFSRLVNVELIPALGNLEPEAVSKREIRAVYDNIATRSESVAKHTLAVLRLLYQWAAEEDHVDTVPVFPRRGTQSNKRDRVLDEAELRAVWVALEAGLSKSDDHLDVDPLAEAFRLLLLTAQRRGEVLSMRWSDVSDERDGAWWTIPAERHKGAREQRVPLVARAVDSLKRLHGTSSNEWVFPSPKLTAKASHVTNPQKAAGRLWGQSKVEGATLHDLRRTAASTMARLGVGRLVVGKVLGHADTDVTGRYDKHAYDREKRAALRKWAAELERIVTAKRRKAESKVLPWTR